MLAQFVALVLAAAEPAATPLETASAFIQAFRRMDQAQFDEYFAQDVTMFFPEGPFPQGRVDGKKSVLAAFHHFFALARERGRAELAIEPLDLRIQTHGNFAVASFRLENTETLGRRTLVLRRSGADWKIIHFHASTVER